MAYLKGEPYVWSDGEKLHIWSINGNDGWSEIEGMYGIPEASGVALAEKHADEFAVMRFAELIKEGRLSSTIERTLQQWSGNYGACALQELGAVLTQACASLAPN